jgi:hypothetical protein
MSVKLFHDGLSTDPDNLKNKIHYALAATICEHTESKSRPCAVCMNTVKALVLPVCKFAYRSAMGNRNDTPYGHGDGYASLGAAIELLLNEAQCTSPTNSTNPAPVGS